METHTEEKSGVVTYLALSHRLRGTWNGTKQQLVEIERRLEALERRARESLESMPAQLRDAWNRATDPVRRSFDFASGDDLRQLAARVEELASRVDKLAAERAPRSAGKAARVPRQ